MFGFSERRASVYDVHRLRLLLELSRRGTLSPVTAALSYSSSTISQQLSQLEAEVGMPLLEPIGRRVRLTPQAEILVSHAETVLRQLEAAETAHSFGALRGESGAPV
jgi:DNA-binding transcriptional LysR family regulator